MIEVIEPIPPTEPPDVPSPPLPIFFQGIKELGDIQSLWKNPKDELPEIDSYEDSDWCFVCYWVEDFGIALNIATYHPSKKGSGWSELNTLKRLPSIIAWMLVDVPEKYYPGLGE